MTLIGASVLAWCFSAQLLADGMISGIGRIEHITGRDAGHCELGQWYAWISPDGSYDQHGLSGAAHQLGTTVGMTTGYYEFTMPAGAHTMLLDRPLTWGRPAVFGGVEIAEGGNAVKNLELPCDYSVIFGTNAGDWGASPWTTWDDEWYQTFVATGTSISGISFKLAGTNATSMNITIHESNGGAITAWPQVGETRTRTSLSSGEDLWVRYRSGEIPTMPGHTYALKLTGVGVSVHDFSVYRRMDASDGYALGSAYSKDGTPWDFDLYAMIFSDNNGTVVPYCLRAYEDGASGSSDTWWQEIRAQGTFLAGASIFFGADTWDIPLSFRIHSGAPTGPQIGPARVGRGAYWATNSGIAGVSWAPGEVALVPGEVYFIKVSHTAAFNAKRFTLAQNSYADGAAWYLPQGANATRLHGIDLFMQVVEYAPQSVAILDVDPLLIEAYTPRGTDAAGTSFIVRNTAENADEIPMGFQVTTEEEWLDIAPAAGVAYDSDHMIAVTFNTVELPLGLHTGKITVTAPAAIPASLDIIVRVEITAPLHARSDFDEDGDVDQEDYGRMQACYSGSMPQDDPDCLVTDIDDDQKVDHEDRLLFMQCFAGANLAVDTLCDSPAADEPN